jgi:hypothetical protein
MHRRPTQGTPAGCFVGTLALFPFAFLVGGVWGLAKWWLLSANDRHMDGHFHFLLACVGGGALLTVILARLAIRILRTTDFRGYDSRDPDQKGLKW